MRVWRFNDSPGSPGLVQSEAPRPTPGRGELLVRGHAAGATPTEWLWHPPTHQRSGDPRRQAVPGHEFSGVLAQVGADAAEAFQVGQAVYGMNDWFADGATAEFCLTVPSAVAPKPARLTHA